MNKMTAIIVLDGDTNNGDLKLSDNGESIVNENEVVSWIIHPDSKVKSITAIAVKPGSTNIFTTGPCQLGPCRNWQGRIGSGFREKYKEELVQEEYNIVWKDHDDKEYTFDPKLIINPDAGF